MSSVLRSLVIKVGVDMSGATSGLTQLSKELKSSGKQITATGTSMTKGITLPVIAAGIGLAKLSSDAGKMADEMLTLSAKTGISTDELQKMGYAARFIDTDLETMTGSMVKLTRNMDSARDGSQKQKEAFAKLGVQYQNTDGSLRNSKTVWLEAIDALGQMSNEADRDAISLNLFGRSAQELNPLIKAGSGALNRYGAEAQSIGAVIDGKTLGSLGALDDKMQQLTAKAEVAKAELGAAFVPVLESITPIITDTLVPAIKELTQWFGEMDDGTRKTIITMAAVAAGVGPLTVGVGKLTSGIGGIVGNIAKATKAGGGFEGVLSNLIGPGGKVMLVVAALALLGVAVAAVVDYMKPGTDEIRKMIKASDDLIDSSKGLEKETNINAEAAEQLTNELATLEKKTKLTKDEQTRMRMVVQQLNDIYPELNLEVDRQTNALNKSTQEVRSFISAKKDQLLLQIYEQRYTDLLKKQVEMEDAVAKKQEERSKQQAKLNELEKNGIAINDGTLGQYNQLTASIKRIDEDLGGLNGQLSENQKEMDKTDKAYQKSADSVEKFSDRVQKDATETAEAEATAFQERKTLREKYQQDFETSKQKHLDNMGNLDDYGIQKTKLTAAEIKKNLEQQVIDMANWRASIAALAKRVPDDVIEELTKLGPEMLPVIQELANMSDTELAEWVKVWSGKSEEATRATEDEMGKMPSIASEKVQGMINAIEAKKEATRLAAEGLARVTKEGLTNNGSLYKTGQDLAQGYVDGIYSKLEVVKSTAGTLVRTALSTVKITQMSYSPSKLTKKLGVNFGEGYTLGIKSEIGAVQAASRNLVSGASAEIAKASIPNVNTNYQFGVTPQSKQALVSSEERSNANLVESFKTALDGMGFYIDNRKFGRLTNYA